MSNIKLKLQSEVGKEKWDLLRTRFSDVQDGIDKNHRAWLYRHTPRNFEKSNAAIELKSWLKGLFESCQLIFDIDDFNDLCSFYTQKLPQDLADQCILSKIVNVLEEAGILTQQLRRSLSANAESVENEILKRRSASSTEECCNDNCKESEDKNKNNKDSENEEDDNDNLEPDIDGFKYFKEVAKICLEHYDETREKFDKFVRNHLNHKKHTITFWEDRHTKRTMEDRLTVIENLGKYISNPKFDDHLFLGVFDGHQGHEAAAFLKTYAPFMIGEIEAENLETVISQSLEDIDQAFLSKCELEGTNPGSTALIAIEHQNQLSYAWLGDCELQLVDKNWELISLVKPHKLSDPEERAKIAAKGGEVVFNPSTQMYRLNGQLAVSRSIGDLIFKNSMIIEPSSGHVDSLDNVQYMFLACDGIYDVIDKEEIPGLIKDCIGKEDFDGNLAKYFVKLAKERRSEDNLSVIVVEM